MAPPREWTELPAGEARPASVEPLELLPFYLNPYRVAGLLLLVNALVGALETMAFTDSPGTPPIPPLVFDVVIGGSLVQGSLRFRYWAIFRAALGLLLRGAVSVAQSDFCSPVFMALYVVGMLNLLVGTDDSRAGKVRIGLSVAAFALYVAVELIGLLVVAIGLA